MLIMRICAMENAGFNIFLCLRCWSPLDQRQGYGHCGNDGKIIPEVPKSPGPKIKRGTLEVRDQNVMIDSLLHGKFTP